MTVRKISRERKTLEESRLLGQRKNVEKTQHQEISQVLEKPFEKRQGTGRAAHSGEPLPAHGSRKTIAEARGKRRKYPGDIEIGDVIGNDEKRST